MCIFCWKLVERSVLMKPLIYMPYYWIFISGISTEASPIMETRYHTIEISTMKVVVSKVWYMYTLILNAWILCVCMYIPVSMPLEMGIYLAYCLHFFSSFIWFCLFLNFFVESLSQMESNVIDISTIEEGSNLCKYIMSCKGLYLWGNSSSNLFKQIWYLRDTDVKTTRTKHRLKQFTMWHSMLHCHVPVVIFMCNLYPYDCQTW